MVILRGVAGLAHPSRTLRLICELEKLKAGEIEDHWVFIDTSVKISHE